MLIASDKLKARLARSKRASRDKINALQSELDTFKAQADARTVAKGQRSWNLRCKERDLNRKHREDASALAAERQLLEAERQKLDVKRQALAAQREELDQQARTLAIATQQSTLPTKVRTHEDWLKASDEFRVRTLTGQSIGGALVVRHLFDPQRSGCVLFEWQAAIQRHERLTFTAYRDGVLFRQESETMRGEFSDRLHNLNRRYWYRFVLTVGGEEQHEVMMELIVPPFTGISLTPSGSKPLHPRDAYRQEQYAKAEFYLKDPKTLQVRKAEIDNEIRLKFGER